MPAKKKKGKGSKLARMSEEERLRYLQHRAELELEAKRRKQQLIAIFTKSKLKREEAFARLNTAKINEQWRFILRQIKCKELYDDLDYLRSNFDETLKIKDAVVHTLYEELEIADLDHRRLQESHIDMIDKLIGRHRERLDAMYNVHRQAISDIETGEMAKLDKLKIELGNECKYLETVIFGQSMCTESTLVKTQTRNAVSTRGIEFSEEDQISLMRQRISGQIEDLWKQLQSILTSYESSTSTKRKQFEYLKEQDDALRLEASQFPRLHSTLQGNLEFFRENQHKMAIKRNERINELKIQNESCGKRISDLRQELRSNQAMDNQKLKRATVVSTGAIEKLKRLDEKGSSLLLLIKMCMSLEPTSLALKKYTLYCLEETNPETESTGVTNPYDKLDKFWEQYNHVQAENIEKKRELGELLSENKWLRHTLRNYLITVSRKPASRPHTSIIKLR